MRLQVFPTSVQGKVAVTNLVAMVITLLTIKLLFPEYVDQEPVWKNLVGDALSWVCICLTFPIGWLSLLFTPMNGPPSLFLFWTVLLVPLNAYFWGAVIERYLEFAEEPGAIERVNVGGRKVNITSDKMPVVPTIDAEFRSKR